MGKSWMIWENRRIHDIYQAQAAKIMREFTKRWTSLRRCLKNGWFPVRKMIDTDGGAIP
jgi:hypothetical protein